MQYRGKCYIVTMAPDGRWTWISVLSNSLCVKGNAITKFEAIDQATHVIDRMASLGARRALPCNRPRLARVVSSLLRMEALASVNRLISRRDEKVRPESSAAWPT